MRRRLLLPSRPGCRADPPWHKLAAAAVCTELRDAPAAVFGLRALKLRAAAPECVPLLALAPLLTEAGLAGGGRLALGLEAR
mmetsp:Transcript_43350/g.75917  ORF Transcript_43350/g.75917 Transcript_43350/m.75917 type:complete len:82 (+) Transcript_43350:173-418(+)